MIASSLIVMIFFTEIGNKGGWLQWIVLSTTASFNSRYLRIPGHNYEISDSWSIHQYQLQGGVKPGYRVILVSHSFLCNSGIVYVTPAYDTLIPTYNTNLDV